MKRPTRAMRASADVYGKIVRQERQRNSPFATHRPMRDTSPGHKAPPYYLLPVAGPAIEPLTLASSPAGLVLGRQEDCDLLLPADADKVSRRHARFSGDGDRRWRIVDLG